MAVAAFRRVTVLGSGGMGTAVALLMSAHAQEVRLWARDPVRAAELAATRRNERHLQGVLLTENITPTADARLAAEGTELIVAAIPSAFLRPTLVRLAASIPAGVPVVSVIKGIEQETFSRPSQIVVETLGDRPVAVLSGPSHAEEIVKGLPTSVVVASADAGLSSRVQEALANETFRVYTNPDALGVELAGALKNVLGVAAGISDGLGFGDNAKAALVTRGLVEIARFAVDLGARRETFWGLAGVGDVVTTCCSRFGRNRAIGEKVGRGMSLAEATAGTHGVAEGVTTARSVHQQAKARGVSMPITDEVYRVLYESKPAREAVTELMLRDSKGEW